MEELINKLKIELKKTLPGIEVQYEMAPLSRPRVDVKTLEKSQYQLSAVLIVFCLDEDGNVFIPLIERGVYNGLHSGQIGFPGGKFETSDENLQNTAIRECYEEIGLGSGIEIIGKLTSLFIPVSSFLVEPYVGVCKNKGPLMIPHEQEVKNVLKLFLNNLMNINTIELGELEVDGNKIKTPYFLVEGYKVWGATAMILNELKTILER
ncbi:MAG: CoA pyrophosphatase [Bacteroidota bacterium]|nr:CoA pyrophosphatase [Bacteroidota bacterium]MDP3144798.1 CoA pyrophosphatase [Bacteroidota bacterium]MDP3557831.1 CoA pyrophosphatase [Bacteroidota bacterium]